MIGHNQVVYYAMMGVKMEL